MACLSWFCYHPSRPTVAQAQQFPWRWLFIHLQTCRSVRESVRCVPFARPPVSRPCLAAYVCLSRLMTMLLDLPVELLHCVAAALPAPSLCVLTSACKAFRSIEYRGREELWRAATLASWPEQATRLECGVMARVGVSWKARYAACLRQDRIEEERSGLTLAQLNERFEFFFEMEFLLEDLNNSEILTAPATLTMDREGGIDMDTTGTWSGAPPADYGDFKSFTVYAHDRRDGTVARLFALDLDEDSRYDNGCGCDDDCFYGIADVMLAEAPVGPHLTTVLLSVNHPVDRRMDWCKISVGSFCTKAADASDEDATEEVNLNLEQFAHQILRLKAGHGWS